MCWATTIGQRKSAGRAVSSASSAGGPPVEVPTSTRPSPTARRGSRLSRRPGSRWPSSRWIPGASRPMRCLTRSLRRALDRIRAVDAARTLVISSSVSSSIWSEIAPSGLATKSIAPRRKACSVTSAPSAVSEDTMTTGQGCSIMMRSRQARPSICGMWMSSVTTSGLKAATSSSASSPLRANCTSKSASLENMRASSFRMRAESSTTRTLVTRRHAPPWPGTCRAGHARRASAARRDRAAGRCGPPARG